MAERGSKKRFSQEQEEYVAAVYNGKVTKNSGATDMQKGDVVTPRYLIEAKYTGEPGKPAKSISIKLKDLEKICDEAWAETKDPMMCLMIHNPESPLANFKGNIHLAVRLMDDDFWYVDGRLL